MSAYKKARKELEHKIDELHKESRVIHLVDDDEFLQISSEHNQQIADLENELDAVESHHLIERAKNFGVDLKEAVGPWYTDHRSRSWLPDKDQVRANRVIGDARFAWWKKWVELLSPVLSVVISLLAVALAALALYLQLKGNIPASTPTP
jgi:hypothetical protein